MYFYTHSRKKSRNTSVFRLMFKVIFLKQSQNKSWTVSLHLDNMWPQFDITNKMECTLKTCISCTNRTKFITAAHMPVWQILNGVSSLLVGSITSPVENITDGLMVAIAPVNLPCHWKLWQIISWCGAQCLRILLAVLRNWGRPAIFSCRR